MTSTGRDELLVLACGELSGSCSSLAPSLCACVGVSIRGFRGAGVGFFSGFGGTVGGGVDSFSLTEDIELQEPPPGEEEEGHSSDAV